MMMRNTTQKVNKRAAATPLRAALCEESRLQSLVRRGVEAVEAAHKLYLDESVRTRFADSLELDAAMKQDPRYINNHRWDYLLGDAGTQCVIALEPHSAKSDEVSRVITKKAAAVEQLKEHLRLGKKVEAWLWVASGKVQFANTEKELRRLDQAGITFVGKRVMAKHLPKR
jgi:hypothetical protein